MSESDIQAKILLALGARPGTRLFRNTIGEGWQGTVCGRTADTVTLRRPRYVTFGLAPGSSDLIGWHNGVFLALEVKTTSGRVRIDQSKFLAAVLAAGGLGGVVRSECDALALIS